MGFAMGRGYNEPMRESDSVNAAASGQKLTYDDFVLFPDDGMRHEIIDGEHYVSPSPNIRHQQVLGALHLLVASWLETRDVGKVFLAPLDVLFSHFDIVEPDLLYCSNERASEILARLHVRGAPELVVEIASPGTRKRDATIKWNLYERGGVSEYWIVDPDADVIRVYRRRGAAFAAAGELSRNAGDVLTTPLLPGLDMPLARIFRE